MPLQETPCWSNFLRSSAEGWRFTYKNIFGWSGEAVIRTGFCMDSEVCNCSVVCGEAVAVMAIRGTPEKYERMFTTCQDRINDRIFCPCKCKRSENVTPERKQSSHQMKDGNFVHWNTANLSISDCKEFMPLITIWLVNLPDLDQADFDLLGKIKWENTSLLPIKQNYIPLFQIVQFKWRLIRHLLGTGITWLELNHHQMKNHRLLYFSFWIFDVLPPISTRRLAK